LNRPALAHADCPGIPDWQDAASYDKLLGIERPGFAWEWLRRRADFRKAAFRAIAKAAPAGPPGGAGGDGARAWHLHAFEDPRLCSIDARPVWAASAHLWVVKAFARRSRFDGDCIALEQLGQLGKLVHSSKSQHLLLSDGFRGIRLDVRGAALAAGPARLSFEIGGIEGLDRPLLVLRRLRCLLGKGRFCSSLHPQFRQAQRQVKLLRTFDALQAGASHADIASILAGKLERRRWRIHSPSLRSQAQRLARTARRLADGGFWNLLE
jgi:hypothetical protein